MDLTKSILKTAPSDARIVRTRIKLREALLALVSERKFETITVADIVARADIGYATFFRHYPDKYTLWSDIADEMVSSLLIQMTPLIRATDTAGEARTLCQYVDAHRAVFRSILASGAGSTVREELARRSLEQAQTLSLRAMSVPRDLALNHAINATLGILVWWLEDHDDVSVDAVGDIIERLIIRPLIN
jgi:AcrR family transcriptional regulator